jgi:omega-6 fatty acid desaturase (delta-12 desaturase)
MNAGRSTNATREEYRRALDILKPFCRKDIGKAMQQLIGTIVGVYGSIALGLYLFQYGWYFSLITVPITAIFFCRSYAIEHDCGHHSFLRGRLQNSIAGNIVAFPTLIPYAMWKFIHNSHHNHVGNLDKRDVNPEMWTMTVNEYNNTKGVKRLMYHFMRSRISRFVFAPIIVFGLIFRIPNPKFDTQGNIGVVIYDLLYGALYWFVFKHFDGTALLLVYVTPLMMFYTLAFYVFYAQHQFEETYWEKEEDWNYEEATFKGSTYLTAPKWFNWISCNVVYHNIHHLISAIPNYNLEKAHLALSKELSYKPISIFSVYQLLDYKLWDEEKKKMVGFPR